ncbi:hypothetical protein [Planomonospora sp. ID67723]|nr:hypothetical protein [Planomonospora sp. ID67723]
MIATHLPAVDSEAAGRLAEQARRRRPSSTAPRGGVDIAPRAA